MLFEFEICWELAGPLCKSQAAAAMIISFEEHFDSRQDNAQESDRSVEYYGHLASLLYYVYQPKARTDTP